MKNKIDVLIGLQWGDEGKGKIIDALTPNYDIIARFQGGPNAGHTLEFNGQKHVLHLIPSGIFHENKRNLLGNGMVICPIAFKKEIESLLPYISIRSLQERIIIADGAKLIMPIHRLLDRANEKAKGDKKIGTTGKGIGPTYTDHTSRIGLLIKDIFSQDFEKKCNALMMNHLKQTMEKQNKSLKDEMEEFFDAIDFIKQFQIVNGPYWINEQLKAEKKILAEGAQGTMLDINFGSYPYVTSSNVTTAGACIGLGIAPNNIGKVYGLLKAYCTRVGSGPFPSELGGKYSDEWCATKEVKDESELFPDADINSKDDFIKGVALRRKGYEFGATTGRLRRTGWLDLPLLKYACMINGVTDLIISKADVLSDFEIVKICTHYKINGNPTDKIPMDIPQSFEPLYKEFVGWDDLTATKKMLDLPITFKLYKKFIEDEMGVSIRFVSTGPDRTQLLIT